MLNDLRVKSGMVTGYCQSQQDTPVHRLHGLTVAGMAQWDGMEIRCCALPFGSPECRKKSQEGATDAVGMISRNGERN